MTRRSAIAPPLKFLRRPSEAMRRGAYVLNSPRIGCWSERPSINTGLPSTYRAKPLAFRLPS